MGEQGRRFRDLFWVDSKVVLKVVGNRSRTEGGPAMRYC